MSPVLDGCPFCPVPGDWRPSAHRWWWCCEHRVAWQMRPDRDVEVRRMLEEMAEAERRARRGGA